MSSFLEKLKKGMRQEAAIPDTVDEVPEQESFPEGVAVLAAYKKAPYPRTIIGQK